MIITEANISCSNMSLAANLATKLRRTRAISNKYRDRFKLAVHT